MALNLSTLTSPATSGNVLEEVTTTADFLEPVPVLRNLSRSSNRGSDAKQDVALNQPKALPLAANGKGYCYLPVTTGNAPAVTFPTIGGSDDFVLEMDVYIVDPLNFYIASNATIGSERFSVYNGTFINKTSSPPIASALEAGRCTLTVERNSGTITLKQDGVAKASGSDTGSYDFDYLSFNGQFFSNIKPLNGYIQKATLSIGGTEELNIDFTANVRHGATKFTCATGQVVTINQSGNDPSTIIKKPVLRFANASDDTTGICLQGLLNQTIDGGYMFAAFSVLGDGGEDTSRIFSINTTGGSDGDYQSAIFSLRNNSSPDDLFSYQAGWISEHSQMFDDDNGDILHEALIKNGTQTSLVNNAGVTNHSNATTISAEEFNIVSNATGLNNAALDLEYLALFSADSVPDEATASKIRYYINSRNQIYLRHDTDGYYFYDAQKAPVGNITDVNTWSGRIVGSDNGDSASIVAQQATANDQPVGDGYVVTFAGTSDHLDIPSTTQAGWQIVGTSLGTFAYKLNNTAVTELNLLGNAGNNRISGDLYGIILLPDGATGRDIEQARKLLIDRGAADGTNVTTIYRYFDARSDIVEFKYIDTSSVTNNVNYAWRNCSNMTSFPALDLSNCASFTSAWQGCSSLTSFPADAKLGTEANNVNFTSAWQQSGLTSFPADIDLSKGINFANTWRQSGLTSFPAIQSTLNGRDFFAAWYFCQNLTSFGAANINASSYFSSSWQSCANLEDFPALFSNWNPSSIITAVFNNAWDGCTSLTAQSVENILTSIDASGKYATSDGDAYVNGVNTQLADSGIDIDYNGDPLSAATTAAISSLKSKGWSIFINSVEQ